MRYLIIVVLCMVSLQSIAQELFCDVRVIAPSLKLVDPAVFRNLESNLAEFINNKQWTDIQYGQDERIECSITINILEELSSTRFEAEMTIIANRPVYNSNYKTILFRHKDTDLVFNYTQDQPMDYDENTFVNNLTSVVGFYAYLIIGYDYDSFSSRGGNPHFRIAEQLVNTAQGPSQTGGFPGWQSNEDNKRRNRYWIIKQLLQPQFDKLRGAYYTYHREGLDMMYEEPEEARNNVLAALQEIESVNNRNPNAIALKIFSVSKNEEVVDMFSDASVKPTSKVKVSNLMTKIDPSAGSMFRKIISPTNRAGNTVSPRSGKR